MTRKQATIAVRSGLNDDEQYGCVVPPIHLSSTYNFTGFNEPRAHDYSRRGNPTRDVVQRALAELEGGAGAVMTNTGMSAIHLVTTVFLKPGDLLVVNNSKVLPARIVGIKQPTGAVCELLLLRQVKGDQWECLAKPGKRMQPGTKVSFGDGSLTAIVDETLEDGNKFVTFYYDTETLYEKLDEFGKMPLPPYITKQLDDQSQYQTVYAKELGSAAAPTAGLHFTPELMDTIRAKGVNITEVTLHVGLGTFRPVQEDEITDHKMHSEWYSVSEETARLIHNTKAAGHRVIAVGTTSCRTLEAVAAKYGEIKACSGNTDIFLYPGVKFNCIDGLITNFHLPESTLIMLVSALYGYEKTMAAYKVAVEQKYRFFSFGDAMLIL